MGLLNLVAIVFVILKLTGNIDWNWFWVLSPAILAVTLNILGDFCERLNKGIESKPKATK